MTFVDGEPPKTARWSKTESEAPEEVGGIRNATVTERADCGVQCEDGPGRGERVGDSQRAGLAPHAGTILTVVPQTG